MESGSILVSRVLKEGRREGGKEGEMVARSVMPVVKGKTPKGEEEGVKSEQK